MLQEPLTESFRLLIKKPQLWIPGLGAGLIGAGNLLLQFWLGTFIAARLWFIEALIIPLLIAGAFSILRPGEQDTSSFLRGGIRYYFPILLPSLVIAFAVMLTFFLLATMVTIIGLPEAVLPVIMLGSAVPIIFFTFFYDTAAVFEDRKVFECIRRSVEVVTSHLFPVIAFFLVSLVILVLIAIPLALAWTGLLYDRLLPLASMDPADMVAFTPEKLNELLGFQGMLITALFYIVGVTIVLPLIYTFKAAFYLQFCKTSEAIPQGEYDEKGRWFKY